MGQTFKLGTVPFKKWDRLLNWGQSRFKNGTDFQEGIILMKIIEQFIKGKYNDPDLCEDAICVTDNFIAVIDGVTSQSDFRYENKKLGKIISDILVQAFPKLDSSMDCYQAIDFLNECVIKYYKDKSFYDKIAGDPANQPAASVIMYSKNIARFG